MDVDVGLHSLDNWLLLLVFSIQLETYGLSCAVIEHVRKRMTVVKGFKCGWYSIWTLTWMCIQLCSKIVFEGFYLE